MKTTFFYVGIRVKDLQQSIDFYENVLGMTLKGCHRIQETQGESAILESGDDGFNLELNYYEQASPYNVPYVVGEGLDHLAFKVENLDDAMKEFKRLDYPCIHEVTTKGPNSEYRWAYIEDPNGIWIEINE